MKISEKIAELINVATVENAKLSMHASFLKSPSTPEQESECTAAMAANRNGRYVALNMARHTSTIRTVSQTSSRYCVPFAASIESIPRMWGAADLHDLLPHWNRLGGEGLWSDRVLVASEDLDCGMLVP